MRVRPKGAAQSSDADDAIFLASSYGLTPDIWQEDALDDWLLRGRQGIWLARTCGIAVPRQNGKNGIIEIRELFGMVVLGEKFLHTAHEVKTARKAFKRLKSFFGDQVADPNAKYPELNAMVVEIRQTNGQEAIVLDNGGSIEFVARSKGSGRGFTVDILVCDEAQDLTDEELEALLPTISAAPLGNPQIIFAGTPPNPDKGQTGEVFTRVRQDGDRGTDPFLAFTDYGVADGPLAGIDLDSLDTLKSTNPALETGRLQIDVCLTERRRMSDAGYARERYGWWGNLTDGEQADVFGEGNWPAAELEAGERPDLIAIGLAVSIDRAYGSIGSVADWEDGSYLLGAMDRRRGSDWLIDAAQRIQDETGCAVLVDGVGPTADLIPALTKAGVRLTILSTEDYKGACGTLFDAVGSGTATHMGDTELSAAVAVAGTRAIGDRWVWARRTSMGDVSMLEAATCAWFGRDLAYAIEDSFLSEETPDA